MESFLNSIPGLLKEDCKKLSEIMNELRAPNGREFEKSELILGWATSMRFQIKKKSEFTDIIRHLVRCQLQVERLAKTLEDIPELVLLDMEETSYLVTREPIDGESSTASIVTREEHSSYENIINELAEDIAQEIKKLSALKGEYWPKGGALLHKSREGFTS